MNRRDLLKTGLVGASALVLSPLFAATDHRRNVQQRLAALQQRRGGRLGVAILDTQTGRRTAQRGAERFLMCSTFKMLAVAAVLAKVDAGKQRLDQRIVFGRDVLLDYAPVTRHHVGAPGLTVAELTWQCTDDQLARPTDRMAACLHHRHGQTARRRPCRLEGGRQNR